MNPHHTTPTTTDAGIPVPSDDHSLTIGPDGPIPLHDHHPVIGPAAEALLRSRFEREVPPLAHQLFITALHLTRNTQDAEDLVQEVMLHAYAGFGSFREGSNLRAWLYRILHNTWIGQYRRKKRRPDEVSVESLSGPQIAAITRRASNASRSAEDSALDSMTDDEVTTALAALREDVRTTVFYADVLELSYKEIAAITDCPVGTVMSRLHRGRKRLRISLIDSATRRGLAPDKQFVQPSSAA